MKRFMLAGALAIAALASPASALVYASFTDTNNDSMTWTRTGPMLFDNEANLDTLTFAGFPTIANVEFDLIGVSSSSPYGGSNINQLTGTQGGVFSGAIRLRANGSHHTGPLQWSNDDIFLTINFTNGLIERDGTTGRFTGNITGVTSDLSPTYLTDINSLIGGNFSMDLTSFDNFNTHHHQNSGFSFRAGSGVFNTAEEPAATPEAATWAMMMLGFGALGTIERGARRRRLSKAAA